LFSGACPENKRIPPFLPPAHTIMHLSAKKHFAFGEM